MKITPIYFNQNSVLNNGIVRTINYIVLAILYLCLFSMPEPPIYFNGATLILFIFVNMIIVMTCLEFLLKRTVFYEWNKDERKKKENYIISYTAVCSALSVSLLISIQLYLSSRETEMPIQGEFLFMFVPVYFFFNILNIPSLFYPLFEKYIRHSCTYSSRPKDWEDDNRIINEDTPRGREY